MAFLEQNPIPVKGVKMWKGGEDPTHYINLGDNLTLMLSEKDLLAFSKKLSEFAQQVEDGTYKLYREFKVKFEGDE